MLETCISPSSILFTDCTSAPTPGTDEPVMSEISKSVSEQRTYPKLQVVKKDGRYFTLNNTQLHVYRRLEESGVCGKVKVTVVPVSDVPVGIRNMMVIPTSPLDNATEDSSRKTSKGYEEVDQFESDEDDDSSDSSEDSVGEYRQCASSEEWSCDDNEDANQESCSSENEEDSFI